MERFDAGRIGPFAIWLAFSKSETGGEGDTAGVKSSGLGAGLKNHCRSKLIRERRTSATR
jgi:hypothetical protein